jgi:SAM-dependent methyltransferase
MARWPPEETRPASRGAPAADLRLYAPATQRNREPILDVLARTLPTEGLVLEVASGTGEHALWFAQHLRPLEWQPSDPDPAMRRSITTHAAGAGVRTLRAPLDLDVTRRQWPIERADAIVCINMIHIAPWSAAEGLMSGAGRLLPPAGVLYLYGPFKRDGRHTAPSNAAFDQDLRSRDPRWGLRDLEAVVELAGRQGLDLGEVVEMPANNLSVIFVRT